MQDWLTFRIRNLIKLKHLLNKMSRVLRKPTMSLGNRKCFLVSKQMFAIRSGW